MHYIALSKVQTPRERLRVMLCSGLVKDTKVAAGLNVAWAKVRGKLFVASVKEISASAEADTR